MQKSVICYTGFGQCGDRERRLESFDIMAGTECIEGMVRKKVIQAGATVILVLCLWGHVSELFDHWDHTAQTGNDTEYSTVIAVLAAGTVILFARALAEMRGRARATCRFAPAASSCASVLVTVTHFIADSPPSPLRI